MLCYPKMYQKDIFKINYDKLKEKNIKCLIFDLDNTLGLIDQEYIDEKTKSFLHKLKNDFTIVIISNNTKERVKKYADMLECDYVYSALKPLNKGFKQIRKRYDLDKKEMAMIGDQLITDILGANLYKIYPILVDPMAKKDLKITYFNRFLERKVLKKYKRKNIMKKGEYYD